MQLPSASQGLVIETLRCVCPLAHPGIAAAMVPAETDLMNSLRVVAIPAPSRLN